MTTREARGRTAAPPTEEETVAGYLQHHPDFFERHQPLLARLRLPHVRGGSTISLVERQIEVLRERYAALEQKLADFVKVARSNDAVAEKITASRGACCARRLAPSLSSKSKPACEKISTPSIPCSCSSARSRKASISASCAPSRRKIQT